MGGGDLSRPPGRTRGTYDYRDLLLRMSSHVTSHQYFEEVESALITIHCKEVFCPKLRTTLVCGNKQRYLEDTLKSVWKITVVYSNPNACDFSSHGLLTGFIGTRHGFPPVE